MRHGYTKPVKVTSFESENQTTLKDGSRVYARTSRDNFELTIDILTTEHGDHRLIGSLCIHLQNSPWNLETIAQQIVDGFRRDGLAE